MKKIILFLVTIMVILWGVNSYGSTINLILLNPTSLVRGTGSPTIKTYILNSSFGGPATVRVTNGSLEDSTKERVSSSIIKLNCQILFSPSQFNQNVYQIEKEVLLARGNNTLEVELRGKPGGRITFQVFQKVSNGRVIPESIIFDAPGASAQISVLGTLTDGTEINITGSSHGTSYSSSDSLIAKVTTEGLVSAGNLGNAMITVRNGSFNAGVPPKSRFRKSERR